MPYLQKVTSENQKLKVANTSLRRQNAALKKQIRLLLAGGREYVQGYPGDRICVWCDGLAETGRHSDYCEAKKAQQLLSQKF